MDTAICKTCGSEFERDEAWKKVCLPCWKKTNKRASSKAPDEVAKLRLRVLVLEQQIRAYRLFRSSRIEPEMLRRLTMLCHPDRHGNSEASTKATAWLLAQRA